MVADFERREEGDVVASPFSLDMRERRESSQPSGNSSYADLELGSYESKAPRALLACADGTPAAQLPVAPRPPEAPRIESHVRRGPAGPARPPSSGRHSPRRTDHIEQIMAVHDSPCRIFVPKPPPRIQPRGNVETEWADIGGLEWRDDDGRIIPHYDEAARVLQRTFQRVAAIRRLRREKMWRERAVATRVAREEEEWMEDWRELIAEREQRRLAVVKERERARARQEEEVRAEAAEAAARLESQIEEGVKLARMGTPEVDQELEDLDRKLRGLSDRACAREERRVEEETKAIAEAPAKVTRAYKQNQTYRKLMNFELVSEGVQCDLGGGEVGPGLGHDHSMSPTASPIYNTLNTTTDISLPGGYQSVESPSHARYEAHSRGVGVGTGDPAPKATPPPTLAPTVQSQNPSPLSLPDPGSPSASAPQAVESPLFSTRSSGSRTKHVSTGVHTVPLSSDVATGGDGVYLIGPLRAERMETARREVLERVEEPEEWEDIGRQFREVKPLVYDRFGGSAKGVTVAIGRPKPSIFAATRGAAAFKRLKRPKMPAVRRPKLPKLAGLLGRKKGGNQGGSEPGPSQVLSGVGPGVPDIRVN